VKDGKLPPQRLSAKLNTDLERIRAENAALMASQLASFRSDLQAIASAALSTIEADTKTFESWNEMLWHNHRSAITRAIWLRHWMLLAGVILLTVMLACVTWAWSARIAEMHQKSGLEAVGMQLHRDLSGTFLIPDPMRITVTRCNQQGREVPCFRVEG
jgi:hypothetical protein